MRGHVLRNTRERLVPTLQEHGPGTYEYRVHLARYTFAAHHICGVVLDIACGTGYGSRYILQTGCARVIGVDRSFEAVEYAVAHCNGPNFIVADGQQLPFPAGAFSAVVSLETIEHVPEPESFLHELHRVLRPGGRLILSTPNYRRGRFLSPFHVRELRHEELEALLWEVFRSDIAWFGQVEVEQRRRATEILRSVTESIAALDRSNVRSRFVSSRLREAIARLSLGVRSDSVDIFPWHPMCLYQIAIVEKHPS